MAKERRDELLFLEEIYQSIELIEAMFQTLLNENLKKVWKSKMQ